MAPVNPLHVVVLMGGWAHEREVSLMSGAGIADALEMNGHRVTQIDMDRDVAAKIAEANPDVVFNALHGRWGEDGCVQGLLEWLQIPYTHSGVMASSIAMDKEKSKDVYRAAGLPVADSILAPRSEVEVQHLMVPPYVVKPYNEGSSVGVYIVQEAANGPPVLSPDMPDQVMVETYVPGRELTCSVLGDRALTVTDIITDSWYDYHAKYADGGSRHEVPAQVPNDIFQACMEMSLKAHQVLGCRGLSRTDFRWDEAKGMAGLILLETNTQPGMTPTSLSPEQAQEVGMSFAELCTWLVEDASCNR